MNCCRIEHDFYHRLYRRCVLECGLFLLSVFIRFLFVFAFFVILFSIAWWPSAGKELSSWLSDCAFLLYIVLTVSASVPFVVWSRIWNSVALVTDHCLFLYFVSGAVSMAGHPWFYYYFFKGCFLREEDVASSWLNSSSSLLALARICLYTASV